MSRPTATVPVAEKKKGIEPMTTVADIVSTMKSKFNASAAAGLDLVFQFNIEDGDNHYLVVKDGTCEVVQGDAEN